MIILNYTKEFITTERIKWDNIYKLLNDSAISGIYLLYNSVLSWGQNYRDICRSKCPNNHGPPADSSAFKNSTNVNLFRTLFFQLIYTWTTNTCKKYNQQTSSRMTTKAINLTILHANPQIKDAPPCITNKCILTLRDRYGYMERNKCPNKSPPPVANANGAYRVYIPYIAQSYNQKAHYVEATLNQRLFHIPCWINVNSKPCLRNDNLS